MKKRLFLGFLNRRSARRNAIALCAVLMSTPLQIMAQTVIDWSTEEGSTLDEVAISTATWDSYDNMIMNGEIPDKKKTVFIYNTRLKKFLQTGAKWGTAATLSDNGMRCWIERYDDRTTSCGTKTIYKIHSVYKNFGSNIAGRSDNALDDSESLSADRGIGVQSETTKPYRGYDNNGTLKVIELWEWCIEKNPAATGNNYFIYRPLWVNLPTQDSSNGNEPDLPAGDIYLIQPDAYTDTKYLNDTRYNNGAGISNFDNYIFAMHYNGTTDGPVGYKPVSPSTGVGTGAFISGDENTYYDMTFDGNIDDWKFINVEDVEKAMETSNVQNGLVVDCTFLINDEGFHRTNSYHAYNATSKPYTAWNWASTAEYSLPIETLKTYVTASFLDEHKSSDKTGKGFEFVPYDPGAFNGAASSTNIGTGWDENPNGKYYCAFLNNKGLLWQEITTPKSGQYTVSVKAAALAADEYLVCAKKNDISGTLQYTTLNIYDGSDADVGKDITNDNSRQHAGQYLYGDEDNHTTTVSIDMNAGEVLVFGVLKLSTDAESKTFTAIDNFKLKYTDNINRNFLLDEDATSLTYLEDSHKVDLQNCYLNRNFVAGNWNTIILPISLTKVQFEETFGTGSKLGVLTAGNNNVLFFSTITVANDDDIILASGTPYIIKVTKDPNKADAALVTLLDKSANFDVNEPYYKISNVTFNEASYTAATTGSGTGAIAPQLRPSDGNANKLTMTGSYVRRYNGDLQGKTPRCYTLNAGAISYYANGAQMKAFRAWITDADDTGAQAARRFGGSFDFTTASATTYIDGVPAVINDDPETPIYNLNGQRVPAGNLPKGIYIKNHKKFIVK